MVTAGHLSKTDNRLAPGPGSDDWSGAEWLDAYRSTLRSFLEGYRIAARCMNHLLAEPMSEKDLIKKALATGNEMFLEGQIERPAKLPVRETAHRPAAAVVAGGDDDLGLGALAPERLQKLGRDGADRRPARRQRIVGANLRQRGQHDVDRHRIERAKRRDHRNQLKRGERGGARALTH